MNKEEIDKILSRLERIDHKTYSCSFEFADSGSFEETCMCFDERKKLANYIKELQQENKQLKEETLKYGHLIAENYRLGHNERVLSERIDKAVDYIETQQKIFGDYDIVSENQLKTLLEILGRNNV